MSAIPRTTSQHASRRILPLWVATLVALCMSPTTLGHPQDGPHADLRIAVGERTLTWNIGMNLAFADEIIDVEREAQDHLDSTEEPALEEALTRHLIEANTVVINGVPTEPVVREWTIGRADSALLPLFPRTGWRALTRFVCVLEYPAPDGIDTLEVSWNGYPRDVLAAEREPGLPAPPMTIEAQLQAEGRVEIIRFIESLPTVSWHALGQDPASGLLEVPSPSALSASTTPTRTSIWYATPTRVTIGFVLVGVLVTLLMKPRVLGVFIVCIGLIVPVIWPPYAAPREKGEPRLADADAQRIVEPLLTNAYEAFTHTDESVIYDLLARSASGDVLDRLYREVYSAMVVSNHDQGRAIIAGITPSEISVKADRPDGFVAEASWEATGSVYHWGHSHDRTYAYIAELAIDDVDGNWMITGLTITDQRRLESPDDALPDAVLPEGFEL